MAVEIIDLTECPPSPPRSSKAARGGMHGEMVPLPFPHGTRLKDHWTQEEHELFLKGLEKCGKGRWSRIARYYLPHKTAQQVQRYAACYFRHNHKTKNRTHSAVNNLMHAFDSYSVPIMADNMPQQPLMLFPMKDPSFPVPPYGATSMAATATANGEVDLELRLGPSQ